MLWNFRSPYSPVRKWSKTQQEVWDKCPKRYYYQYRATQKGSGHHLRQEILSLKDMKTLPLMKGELVHAAIADFIRNSPNQGDNKVLHNYFTERWNRQMTIPQNVLLEFVNEKGVSNLQISSMRDQCETLLANFFHIWPGFSMLEILYIDDPDDYANWFFCGGFGVYAKPDLIVRADKFIVIDWKTGHEPDNPQENDIQMAASIFLACFIPEGKPNNFPEEFEGYFYYLESKSKSEVIAKTKYEYERFTEFVDSQMKLISTSNNEADYESKPAGWKCKFCNFATICEQGRTYLP